MRRTRHLELRSCATTLRSLALLRAIFGSQYAVPDLGLRQCHRQPCQKQPSTKTAKRLRGKMKSGRPGSGECRRHPVTFAARSIAISFSSVAWFPFERISAILAERISLVSMSANNKR
jgi:hypothetical protein